jgi:hypothetical protein
MPRDTAGQLGTRWGPLGRSGAPLQPPTPVRRHKHRPVGPGLGLWAGLGKARAFTAHVRHGAPCQPPARRGVPRPGPMTSE